MTVILQSKVLGNLIGLEDVQNFLDGQPSFSFTIYERIS